MYDDYQRLLTKVATLYYIDDVPQNVIAEDLRLSKSKVCRMLAEAKKKGIVHVSVFSSHEQSQIERTLEKHYGLREAIIVSDTGNGLEEIGIAGSEFLRRTIREGDIVGVSWGRTLYQMVEHLSPFKAEGVQIVQLVGGLDTMMNQVQSSKLAMQMAMNCGCTAQLLYCPAKANSMAFKNNLLQDPVINRVFQIGRESTMALVGIGAALPTSDLFQSGYLPVETLRQLRERGAVGDICMHFYDEQGREVETEDSQMIMSITLDDLRKIPNVVGLAKGREKAEAIIGALKGKMVNTLITDKDTALYVLQLDGIKPENI